MDTKHDAIIAVSDEGGTFLVRIVTDNEVTMDTIYQWLSLCGEINLEDTSPPAGLYYATARINYCNGKSCGAYEQPCDCGSLQWTDLAPIYQLSEVK